MTIRRKFLLILTALFFLAGCGGDDEKGDYSGVGKLISDRNKARIKKASSKSRDNTDSTDTDISDYDELAEPEKKSSGLVFEENVKIVSETSGKTIAKATAYLDKSGRIVNIRIRKNR